MPRFILKCKSPNEIDFDIKPTFLKIREEQGLKSLTSFEN